MAYRSEIPEGDQTLEAWVSNFSAKITATPTAYGLVAGDATAHRESESDSRGRRARLLKRARRRALWVFDGLM